MFPALSFAVKVTVCIPSLKVCELVLGEMSLGVTVISGTLPSLSVAMIGGHEASAFVFPSPA